MPDLSISLLGQFAIRAGDRPLKKLRSRSVAALLIVLTSEAQPLRREWLIELLWPGSPVGTGRKNLRQTLYELRQAIPEIDERRSAERSSAEPKMGSAQPFVLADRQSIWLNEAGDYRVDTAEFATLLDQGEIAGQRKAAALYQGDFLAGFYLPDSSAFEEWAAARRALYRRLVLDALERVAQHDLQKGSYAKAAEAARRQLEIDSLGEKALQQLMIALALDGQRSAALAAFEKGRQELWEELGVDPGPATEAIYERIAAGEIHPAGNDVLTMLLPGKSGPPPAGESDMQTPAEPNLEAPATPEHNLPAEPTPFVGRRREVADLVDQLPDPGCRLLTVLGPGGCGKSRLAIQAARRLAADRPDAFPDGVWYASLAQPADTSTLVSALVDGLPFKAFDLARDLASQLFSYLEQRRILLLLDNMEYAQAPEGTRLIAELLERAARITILACSRTRLNLHAEQLFPLAGLEVPEEAQGMISLEESRRYSAMQLFLNSARRVRPDFELTEANVLPVLAICRQLGGIPLAVELAASWIEVMSPAEVAVEVERCLDFLETDWVDVPERQRSLKTVFETSWRLLDSQERAAFLRLSVFRRGFDYEAARQVADASHRTLLGLLNKSWLRRDESGRYLAHEMLRQYAYQRLADDDIAWEAARDRHGVHFAHMMREQGELLKGPQQIEATARIEADLENIVVAWEWLVDKGRFETAIDDVLPGLFLYFAARARGGQLVAMVDRAHQRLNDDDNPAWQVVLLATRAAFPNEFLITRYFVLEVYSRSGQEQIEGAYTLASEHELTDRLGLWSLLLAMLYGWAFDHSGAIGWLRRLVDLHRRQDDRWLLAFTLENLGGLLMPSGLGRPGGQAGTSEAHRYLAEAKSLFEALGDRRERGYTLRLWGLLSRGGDFSEAKRLLLLAQQDFLAAGDPVMATDIDMALAGVCVARAEVDEAFSYYQHARKNYAQLGNRHFEAGALSQESLVALRLGTVEHARAARQESLAIARATGNKLHLAWGTWELGEVERVSGNYDLARSLFEEARPLFTSLEDPFGRVFYERGLGDVYYGLGNYEEASHRFEESLRLAKQHSHQWAAAYAHFGLGRVELALAEQDQIEQVQDRFLEGLRGAYYHRYIELYNIGLSGLAACYAAAGRSEEALRLTGIVLASPLTWQETRGQASGVQEAILADRPELAGEMAEADGEIATIRVMVTELIGSD
ncbi:MAG: tetratricopeptide repeat protein [Chloroflexota bacterium]|nr:MAG: tetratricopeptide repeat protein [Chloroflexota bacterium]